MTEQDEKRIRERAHQMWVDDGCPDDRALEYWLAAERELLGPEAENIDAGTVTPPDIVRTGTARMLDGPLTSGDAAQGTKRGASPRTRSAGKAARSNAAGHDLGA